MTKGDEKNGLANIMAERGVWVGGVAGLCCWVARRAVRTTQAAAAPVADVETVHKKDRPACWHTSRRKGKIT